MVWGCSAPGPGGSSTADPSASPGATEPPFLNVSGSIAGEPFVLDSNAVVTLDANGRGSYSGPDLNDGGLVSGTFSCG